jgi:hypothetical protein
MRRTIAPILSITALLALVAAPTALAKEFVEATLDAPIAMGTPGGTEIIIGVTLMVPDPETGEMHRVDGSPIEIRLTGPGGATTRAAGAQDGIPGHYVARIAIPEGGAREIEIGIDGTTDMPMLLASEPFAFGQIGPRTAQLAPPIAPAAPAKPAPVAQRAVEPEPVPAVPPTPVVPSVLPAGLVAIVVLAALATLAATAGVAVRRRRAPGTAPRSA